MFGSSISSPQIDPSELAFQAQMRQVMDKLQLLVDAARLPQAAANVPHTYEDKFGLAEFLSNSALAATLIALEFLGLTQEHLKKILALTASGSSISLRFHSAENVSFVREFLLDVESSQSSTTTETITETSTPSQDDSASTIVVERTKTIVTKVPQYVWKLDVTYELFAFAGAESHNDESRIIFQRRTCSQEFVTPVKKAPQFASAMATPSTDLNLSWLFSNIESTKFCFKIDREDIRCRTPRRNSQVEAAVEFFSRTRKWAAQVSAYFDRFFALSNTVQNLDFAAFKNTTKLFVPFAPLFSSTGASLDDDSSSEKDGTPSLVGVSPTSRDSQPTVIVPLGQLNSFLWEQKRSISEQLGVLSQLAPAASSPDAFATIAEAGLLLLVNHLSDICLIYRKSVDYVEKMLLSQLEAAVGKNLTPSDFSSYMKFHQKRLFSTAYCPKPFSHAIRRPGHYPEGTLSICQAAGSSQESPILTFVRKLDSDTDDHGVATMSLSLNSTTEVVIQGDKFLHATVLHKFASSPSEYLSLIARARQFSSFVLLVGRIESPTRFEPSAAIIVQNSDELEIPLNVKDIAAPKDFEDALVSLSPEQQAFCRAYRQLQLQSTLFGICVVQIKPNLERLLNLPPNSLTKEIALTQDIMQLFVKYHIPSDLLSFDVESFPTADASTRLKAVKDHVNSLLDVIDGRRSKDLQHAAQNAIAASVLAPQQVPAFAFGSTSAHAVTAFGSSSSAVASSGWIGGGIGSPAQSQPALAFGSTSASPTSGWVGGIGAPAQVQPTPMPTFSVSTTSSATQVDSTLVSPSVDSSWINMPHKLDKCLLSLDATSSVRPAIINMAPMWQAKTHANILSPPQTTSMGPDAQRKEKQSAFDLLDALSRSGELPLEAAEFHAVVAVTHSFDHTLIGTVIEKNQNPIDKLEQSLLIVASSLFDQPAIDLKK